MVSRPFGEWDFVEEKFKLWGESIVSKTGLFKKLIFSLVSLFIGTNAGFCASQMAQADLSIVLPNFTKIAPVTSPVLTAHITNRTGNLYAPMMCRFRVITNSREVQTLYLKSNVLTEGGYEESMFEQGGQVYIAFANLAKIPKASALANCKIGALPEESPGIVAYPVTSIIGAENRFIPGKNKYEVYVKNGTTDVTVNVGSNVLKSSFGKNDPRGFYQAVLSLTDTDI